jgi:hypothetical protein
MLSKIGKFRSGCEEITQPHLEYKKEALVIFLEPSSFTHYSFLLFFKGVREPHPSVSFFCIKAKGQKIYC